MLTITGQVLDMYDDPKLEVLLGRHGEAGVRSKFAFEVPAVADLDQLEDDAFGAVFYSPEKTAGEADQRRCWPVHEKGSCAISIEYFDKVAKEGALFPDEVRNQIACNIVANADLFGAEVPAEMRKWAEQHGEYLPDDNWVNLSAYEPPGGTMPEKFAYEKRSVVDGTARFYPLDDPECVAASIESFTKEGWELTGMSEWEARIAANHIVKAAQEHDVGVPEGLEVFATLDVKTAEEIHGSLLWRAERIPVAMRDTDEKVAKIHRALATIESREDPIKMAAGVAEFDLAVGFGEEHYIDGLCRPEEVIFTPATKLAEVEPPLLEKIGREKIRSYLGDEALAEFEKDAAAALEAQDEQVREFLLNA